MSAEAKPVSRYTTAARINLCGLVQCNTEGFKNSFNICMKIFTRIDDAYKNSCT